MATHVEDLIQQWTRIQLDLRKQVVTHDMNSFSSSPGHLPSLIGGIDISYFKDDTARAYVTLVVLERCTPEKTPKFDMVYCHSTYVSNISVPYFPSFLAFREVDLYVSEVNLLKQIHPELIPEIFLVDGNGLLHPRKFGCASHLGVLINIPTIGVAKNPYLFNVQNEVVGSQMKKEQIKANNRLQNEQLIRLGDTYEICNESDDTVIGKALKSTFDSKNPIYISIGHMISLESAIRVVLHCCVYKVPEPIRQADMISREYVRKHS